MIGPGMMISDRYEIVDKVGSGGMADVYKAKDHRLNRFVAIKILKQEYNNDSKFVTKFRVEAQSVAGLSNPNIVNVFDVGEDDNLYYIVMELVEGITLKKFIEKKGRLEVEEAVSIAIKIAQGMEAAHENHIIHRDIKPQNIIISKEGKVKVTDFGIAKAVTSNTITSNAMGSVHYISPEQARGGYSDEKSDIYSLGVTMYEMLSGSVPFEGESTVSVALAHIQDEAVLLEKLDPDIPRSLSRIVQKCMQKKPEMRYLTARELILDLKRAIDEPDGNYVKIEQIKMDSSPTRKISKKELDTIKGAVRVDPVIEPMDTENDEEEPEIDPRLEKILKICSAVVAVLLVIGVIMIVGWFMGIWGRSGHKENVDATSTPAASEDASGKVEVPGLVGKSLEDAENLLKDANLHWQLKQVDSDEEENTVTDQDPKEGESVDEYSLVTIYVSQSDNGVVIPDVTKKTEADARKALEDLGLSVGTVKKEYSNSIDEGCVIDTDPVMGSSVDKGSTVNLVISEGSESDQTVVPNIVGKKVSVALERLEAAGLKGDTSNVTYVHSDKYAKDYIASQAVVSGQKVRRGTVVAYSVSLGPEVEETPQPTKEPAYTYEGSLTINSNPFDSEDEAPADIKLVLTQDGKTKPVWQGTLSYSDFPKTFPIVGWSENSGTVILCKDNQNMPGSYTVDFTKEAK